MIDLENQEREIINLMFSQRISWLAAVRIRHKLSLAEVSKMLGISINSLKQIEKTERLSSNIKSKMAETYGCPPELLICPSWMTAEHK
ncbi:helix-turn-helix transcriptional regulator [Escherichia coli]|uniref:helix-turn-helix domain-containing protein n=1 Tax=Escherichia coli TaxID=562 RepID=UPI00148357A4|nr:helix-turn-helix transcriptional regulator [Escherichia coli]MCV5851095.1 helix-turn-helix transcriptional regulator [Escherichia coli]MDQ9278507.1 helix-turn-helix transcriptional regulator [Escherichia coli]NNT55103.1 helix-turn-helix transcriptional regulator [Escherichia coli]NNT81365.1 helix-turn-helix transcriptional regulator [Escherichia coli]HAI4301223.1 helix-turn-helix transcriptional regulator [Escherichia coli]